MRRLRAALLSGLLAAALLCARAAVGLCEDFNEARLHAGQADYQAKKYIEAIDEFRIAAFGYLDQPVALSECLVRLSLAQSAAGKTADVDATLIRFLEVERRFNAYGKAKLEPETRTAFRALLAQRVPEATLLAVPSLSGLVETQEQKIATLPPPERQRALEAAVKREPNSVRWPLALARNAMEQGDAKDAERWAGKALALDGSSAEALALRAQARVARAQCADAMKDLAALSDAEFQKRPELYADKFVCLVEGKDWVAAEQVVKLVPSTLAGRSDVARARQQLAGGQQAQSAKKAAAPSTPTPGTVARGGSAGNPASQVAKPTPPAIGSVAIGTRSKDVLAESRRQIAAGRAGDAVSALIAALKLDPSNRDLRLALLEATCLTRAYPEGAAQVALVAPFADGEAPSMFYAAVVLYETGKTAEARNYLKSAMPRVSGPLVDEYSKKILGQ